ncbi:MAG: hypothetical protein K2N51_08935 [Lachnospiraceae bacterium]|nr:hypothetical protein [Lachnospiraceae bacterium]
MKKLMLFITTVLLFIALAGCSASDNNKDNNTNIAKDLTKLDTDSGKSSTTEEPQNSDGDATTVISSETSWAFDVSDPSVVLKNSDYFLKVRVKTKEKTKYFVKNTIMPSSTYNLEVLDVLKNDDGTVPKNIKLAVEGGIVSMQDYVNTMDEDTKKKTKADKLSKKELKENVMINDESYYELKQGQEYYILVCDLTNDENYKGYYGMGAGGYDVFQEKNGEYINVLTNRTLDIQK